MKDIEELKGEALTSLQNASCEKAQMYMGFIGNSANKSESSLIVI
jgi:hypothetical protein